MGESYLDAGYNSQDPHTKGSRMAENGGIVARKNWLQSQAATATVLTITEKREFLARVVRAKPSAAGPDNPDSTVAMSKAGPYYSFPDKIAAIKLDNDLGGDGADAALAITITRAWK